MVLIVISPSLSRNSRQRACPARERAASFFSSCTIRSRISAAAWRVKVIARTFDGSTPARSRFRYRATSTDVLPVPAEASSTTLRRGSTAATRAARSEGAPDPLLRALDIVLAADGWKGTGRTP